MEKAPKKKHKIPDHFTSEFHDLSRNEPGTLMDFVGVQVVEPRNPNHRPDIRVVLGRTEMRPKEVLRAKSISVVDGSPSKLVRIQVPQEEMVHTGDVLVDAIDVLHIDADALCTLIKKLQKQKLDAIEQWETERRERKRERRRRYQRRKRERLKKERNGGRPAENQEKLPRKQHQITEPERGLSF